MIKYIKGDLLDAKTDIIGHQVNAHAIMAAGVAKQIKNKWPIIFKEYYDFCINHNPEILGTCQVVKVNDTQYVANLFGQFDYDASKRQTNYEAIYKALETLSYWMAANNLKSVAFPFKLSSGLAGAEWTIIEAMIKFLFKDFEVEIWEKK
jgi:O-acetyl-ADP-ribose deacetylase (regulator of RNase III)